MTFFLRKALKFGPLRLNLSKSGVGASVGVTGARIGVRSSDRQPYVYGGRYGLYYRQNLGSVRQAELERAAEALEALIEERQEQWLPAMRTFADASADAAAKQEASERFRECSGEIVGRLKEMGFPIDAKSEFSQALSEIQSDLMLQVAFPEAYEKWDESCDELLERAARRARQIVNKHQGETLLKLAKRQPLPEVVSELAEKLVLPQLKSAGLVLEGNPVYEMRLSLAVSGVIFDDLDRCIPE
jgi:hypothetical protein